MTTIPPTQAFLNKWDVGNQQHSMTKPHGGDGKVSMAETDLNLAGLSKHTLPPGREKDRFVADLNQLIAETSLPEFKKFADDHLDPYAMTAYLYHKYPDFFAKWDNNQDTQLSKGELDEHGGIDQMISELRDLMKDNPAHAHMLSKARMVIRKRFYMFDNAGEKRLRDAAANMANQNAAPTSTVAGLAPAAGQSVPTNRK